MHHSRRLGGGATGFPWLPQWPGSDTKDLRCTVRCLGSQSGVTSYSLASLFLQLSWMKYQFVYCTVWFWWLSETAPTEAKSSSNYKAKMCLHRHKAFLETTQKRVLFQDFGTQVWKNIRLCICMGHPRVATDWVWQTSPQMRAEQPGVHCLSAGQLSHCLFNLKMSASNSSHLDVGLWPSSNLLGPLWF